MKAFPIPVPDQTCGSRDVKWGGVGLVYLVSVKVGKQSLGEMFPVVVSRDEKGTEISLLNCHCTLLDEIYWLSDQHCPCVHTPNLEVKLSHG